MLGRRRYERVAFFCPVELHVLPAGPVVPGRTFDISIGGVGVTSQIMLERGQTLRIRFRFRDASNVAVDEDVMGQVAYCRADEDGDRIGIEFLETVDEAAHPMLAYRLNKI